MLQIDISSDIDQAMSEVHSFWRGQIPFATSRALNDTAFDVRKHIVEVTYPKAFEVRNRVFPGRLWRVTPKATKARLEAIVSQVLTSQGYGQMMSSHAEGGIRKNRGRIAIPAKPDTLRSKTGRIRVANKPRNIVNKRDVFIIEKGQRKFILKRGKAGQKDELLYSIVPEANIKRTFRAYADAEKVTMRVFSGHWNIFLNGRHRG